MPTEKDVAEAVAKALAALADSEFRERDVAALLQRLYKAERNMDEAIAKADTFEEFFSNIGEGLAQLLIEAATRFVKQSGPLGLADAALQGVQKLADFLNGGD